MSESQKDTDLISSVYIKIENEYKTEDILKEIHSTVRENFEVVYPKQIVESLSTNLEGIYNTTHAMMFLSEVFLFCPLEII